MFAADGRLASAGARWPTSLLQRKGNSPPPLSSSMQLERCSGQLAHPRRAPPFVHASERCRAWRRTPARDEKRASTERTIDPTSLVRRSRPAERQKLGLGATARSPGRGDGDPAPAPLAVHEGPPFLTAAGVSAFAPSKSDLRIRWSADHEPSALEGVEALEHRDPQGRGDGDQRHRLQIQLHLPPPSARPAGQFVERWLSAPDRCYFYSPMAPAIGLDPRRRRSSTQ